MWQTFFFSVKLLRRKWKSFRDCFARENNRLRQEIIQGQVGARKTQYVYYKQLLFLHENDPENAITLDTYLQDGTTLQKAKEQILRRQNKKEQKSKQIKSQTPKTAHTKKEIYYQPDYDDVQYPFVNFVDSFEVSSNNMDFDEDIEITQPIVEINENPQNGFRKTDLFSQDSLGPIEIFPVINGKPVPPSNNDHLQDDTDKLFLMSLLEPLKTIPEKKRFGIKIKLMNVLQKAQAEEGILNNGTFEKTADEHYDEDDDNSGYSSEARSLILLEPEMEIVELE